MFRIARAERSQCRHCLALGNWDDWVKRGGQMGSVYKQPEKREDDSCHSWRAQVSGKGYKGVKEE